jgi:hypothetical protein
MFPAVVLLVRHASQVAEEFLKQRDCEAAGEEITPIFIFSNLLANAKTRNSYLHPY